MLSGIRKDCTGGKEDVGVGFVVERDGRSCCCDGGCRVTRERNWNVRLTEKMVSRSSKVEWVRGKVVTANAESVERSAKVGER